jgi:hypothetical protein
MWSWVAGLECSHIHAEDQDVDTVITASGYRVERGLRPGAFLRVPIPHPWLHALLKLFDDAVGELLHRVAAFGDFTGMMFERHGSGNIGRNGEAVKCASLNRKAECAKIWDEVRNGLDRM